MAFGGSVGKVCLPDGYTVLKGLLAIQVTIAQMSDT